MSWAALGKSFLKAGVKKVAKDKLLNRKNKTSKRRVSSQKMMGGGDKKGINQPVKGGALAVIPKSPLVASPSGELAKIPEKPQEDVVYTIRTRVIEIDKLLKGTLAAEKAQKKEEKEKKERVRRQQKEEKLEKPDKGEEDEETPKKLLPKIGFLEKIKQFITKVLVGWIAFNLIKFLPKLQGILKFIGGVADFLIEWGGKLLNGLVTFIDWGYKAVDATQGWIKDKFGEDAAQKFESFMGNLTKMFNGIVLLGMGIAKMAGMGRPKGPKGPKGKQPKPKPKPKPKWQKALQKRWKNSRVGRFFRNNAAARKKLVRRISRPVSRAVNAIKPKNIVENLKKTKLGQRVTQRFAKASQQVDNLIKDPGKSLKNLQKTKLGQQVTKTTKTITDAVRDPKKALENLKKTQVGKKVTEIAKKVDPRKWKMPKLKTPGWMKKAGSVIKKGFVNADAWIKSIPAKTRQMWDDVAKNVGPYIDEMGEGIGKIGKNIGAKYKEVAKNMEPQKVIDDLTAKIRPAIDDVLKKSPILSKLSKGLNPKSVQGLLTKAANNPALKKLINTLKANKGASKGLGPIDKIITALMTLWDYTMGREAPVNAILKGLGGLFGYGVGFSAASAVPVLGQSGVFNFAGGMAGGIAGEWLAMKTAKLLAKTPLGEIDDPIMGPKDIEAGLPARKLVRDPDGLIDHMIAGPKVKDEDSEGSGEETKETKDNKKIDKEFKMGKKTYDLSKLQGGLSNEDYLALSNKDRGILDRRMRIYQSQNYEQTHANIKGNSENIVPLDVNSVAKKTNDVSNYASYEEGADETVVIKSGSQEPNLDTGQTKEKLVPVNTGGGSGSDEVGDLLYKGG